jgi:hypothetical protein
MRALWLLVGLVSLGCGIAGIVLPLVPTTPFLLLAAFAFARSSDRLHAWLVDHPRLGPPIQDWHAHGAIGRRAKWLAAAAMAATFGVSVAAGVRLDILALQAVVLLAVAVFILSRPSPPGDTA